MSDFHDIENIRRSLRMAELQLEKRDWNEVYKYIDIALNTLKKMGAKNVRSNANRKRKKADS